ncbi:MAG: bifunctional 4-hydroxy-2-oxoglutarate aldolase/2-dehydro-3-deoxy-phosphogluconate aldolase [Candidatus Bathyarchaeia archaeon]
MIRKNLSTLLGMGISQKVKGRRLALSMEVLSKMERAGIIPVVVIEDPGKAVQLGKTMMEAGLDLIEITMRTERAMEAVKILGEQLPELTLGAGTVFSLQAAKEAIKHGARFIVSPHLDEEIVTYCVDHDIVCIPGVYTPSEVQRALAAATRNRRFPSVKDIPLVIKIFPASTGGPGHIKAMKAVFPEVKFLPLGGVDANNMAEYFKAGAWAVGGTWICKKELIDRGNFDEISRLVKEALRIIREVKKA